MKSRTMAVALMVSWLFVLAASGQARADKINPMAEAVLQDDNTGSFMLINISTGEYKFHECNSSLVMGGFATVNITGCAVAFKEVSEERLGGGDRHVLRTGASIPCERDTRWRVWCDLSNAPIHHH